MTILNWIHHEATSPFISSLFNHYSLLPYFQIVCYIHLKRRIRDCTQPAKAIVENLRWILFKLNAREHVQLHQELGILRHVLKPTANPYSKESSENSAQTGYVVHPSKDSTIYFLIPSASRLRGAGDSAETMGWYHWSSSSSLSAGCTITGGQ